MPRSTLWYSWEQASVLPSDPNGSSFSDRAPFWDNPTHSPQRFGYWPSLHSNLSFKYVFDHKGLKAIQNFSGIKVLCFFQVNLWDICDWFRQKTFKIHFLNKKWCVFLEDHLAVKCLKPKHLLILVQKLSGPVKFCSWISLFLKCFCHFYTMSLTWHWILRSHSSDTRTTLKKNENLTQKCPFLISLHIILQVYTAQI